MASLSNPPAPDQLTPGAILAIVGDPAGAAKRLKELHEAEQAARQANMEHAASRAQLEAATRTHDEAHKRAQEAIDEVARRHVELDARAQGIADREAALTARERQLAVATDHFNATAAELDQRERAIDQRRAAVETDRVELDRRLEALVHDQGQLALRQQALDDERRRFADLSGRLATIVAELELKHGDA